MLFNLVLKQSSATVVISVDMQNSEPFQASLTPRFRVILSQLAVFINRLNGITETQGHLSYVVVKSDLIAHNPPDCIPTAIRNKPINKKCR